MNYERLNDLRLLGLTIAYYRRAKGMTQAELAEAVHISRTHMSYRQRSMKGSWLQLVIGVLDIVIAWIFLGATPMVSVTLVSTLVGIELIFSAASLFSFASLFVKQQ